MSAAPSVVSDDELAFFFQTNEPIPARPLLAFIWEVERIALTRRYFGPDALVEITEIKTGTKLVRLSINQKIGIATAAGTLATAAVAVAEFGLHIADRVQRPTGRLAETVAEMCLENGVAECVITTSDAQISIGRDHIPAIETVKNKRESNGLRKLAPDVQRHPLRPDDSVSATRVEEVRLDEPVELTQDLRAEVLRPRDGRIYTMLGTLRRPGDDENVVPPQEWEFLSQSGKPYIARGVDASRIRRRGEGLVVIRAEIVGREDNGIIILDIKDVFEPEEP